MNAKQFLLAASLITLTSTAAFAADTAAPAGKTRAEVLAELSQARANGEEIGLESFAWYPAQQQALAKANAEKAAAAKANAEKVATAKTDKAQQN